MLWESGVTAPVRSHQKTIRHPELGDVSIDCDVLADVTTSLRLVVYHADPATPDGRALAVLGAAGAAELSY